MHIQDDNIELLFDVSWEVCNKIGGIYTVLSTKARSLQQLYKDKVIFVGPDVWSDENPSPFFKETKTLLKEWRKNVMLPEGITVRIGRWEIPGRPIAVLVGFAGAYALKNEFYGHMWELYGVDSLHAYGDYDEACAFAHAAGMVVESIVKTYAPKQHGVVAHFEEWTTGMGLLYTKATMPGVATVFTTHATSIGRSIAGNGKPLYDYFAGYDGDQMARELNMESKHSLEKAAALNADCFTTVSDITADECAQLLGRRPDVVTYNGFEKDFVPRAKAFAGVRNAARRRMLDVANALTGTEYDDTFIVITSGRCEYRNKGLDLYLDALKSLDAKAGGRRVLAFVMVPAWVREPRPDLMGLSKGERLEEPVITHLLNNHDSDPVLQRILALGFDNNNESHVSVIYVPCYLTGDDGIFNMTYYNLLAGADATVFASYYEPWGYTPLESVAFGVPTVTTTLSGFGRWVMHIGRRGLDKGGVIVEDRTDSDYDDVRERIASDLHLLASASDERLTTYAKAARMTADLAGWETFISLYREAYELAVTRAGQRVEKR